MATDSHITGQAGDPSPASSVKATFGRGDPPKWTVTLWPHRSLSTSGFRWVLGFTAAALAIPLIPFLGTPIAWGLLPFLIAALLALYISIKASYHTGRMQEDLRLWDDLITLERTEPTGKVRRWHANPYWTTVHLHENAKLESYLTLKGNGREVELGSFLSPEERVALHAELKDALARL